MRSLVHVGLLAALGGLLLPGPANAQTKDAKKRVNVIFILADDLGWADLGCYGHPHIKTPNLDKLARQGMRFTQFYTTSPVCTPSRASFLTGRHPQRFGIHHADLPETLPRYPLPAGTLTIMQLLRQLGYRTAHFGKWHLGEPPHTGMPRTFGLEHFFGSMGGRPSSSWTKYARYDDAQFILNEEQPKTYPGYATDVLTDHVLKYVEDARQQDRPFYVNVWFNSPHEPLSPRVEQAQMYDGHGKKERVYFGSVANLDHNVGRILAKLAELGLEENTLLIFSSDNGPEVHSFPFAAGSAGRLRGWKTQLWEGGLRVPLIVRLPGVVPAGKTTDAVSSALDFVPTVCELARADAPPKEKRDEGISLVPVLTGKGEPPKRTLYWECHIAQRGGPASGTLVIRDADWKLHLWQKEDKRALYDLARDIGESKDISADHKDVADRLEMMALEWYRTLPREDGKKQKVAVPATEAEANRLPLDK